MQYSGVAITTYKFPVYKSIQPYGKIKETIRLFTTFTSSLNENEFITKMILRNKTAEFSLTCFEQLVMVQ